MIGVIHQTLESPSSVLTAFPGDIGVLPSLDNMNCFFPLVLELVLVITVEHHHQDDGNDHHTEDG